MVALTPTGEAAPSTWTPINLADQAYETAPDPPDVLGLLYAGRRHVLSGPPEAAKTLLAYILLLTALRQETRVAIVDFEMGPYAARRMLTDLGATLDELRHIHYVVPEQPPGPALIRMAETGIQLVMIDAAIGAYDATGLDDDRRKDAQTFQRTWIDPLWKQGVGTLTTDHVTKQVDSRGKWAIGSERKLGAADVHLGCEVVRHLTRGGQGVLKVHTHKDRPGYLTRPISAIVTLHSDPDTHQITWQIEAAPAAAEGAADGWRPTVLMERVSRYLEQQTEPVPRKAVEEHVRGKSRDTIRMALDHLLADGYATEQQGARGARLVRSTKTYREADAAAVPQAADPLDLIPVAEEKPAAEDDPEIRRLLEKYGQYGQT